MSPSMLDILDSVMRLWYVWRVGRGEEGALVTIVCGDNDVYRSQFDLIRIGQIFIVKVV